MKLKELMEKYKFKQIIFIEWIKIEHQQLNSNINYNYLTNCREIALFGIKGYKPIFNSKFDNGIYFIYMVKRIIFIQHRKIYYCLKN